MGHLDEGTIHAWLDGALQVDESTRIERHVAECPACSAAVAEARGLVAAASRIVSSLDVVRGGVIPEPVSVSQPRRSMWKGLHLTPLRAVLAASLLLAVGLVSTMRHIGATVGNPKAAVALEKPMAATKTPPASSAQSANTVAMPRSPAHGGPVAPRAIDSSTVASVAVASAAREKRDAPDRQADKTADAHTQRVSAAAAAPRPSNDSTRGVPTDASAQRSEQSLMRIGEKKARSFAAAQLLTTGAEPVAPGCYRIVSDSVATELTSIGFPSRFSLQLDAAGPHGVVRAVSASGRVDSVLANFNWGREQANSATISWNPVPSPASAIGAGAPSQRASALRESAMRQVVLIQSAPMGTTARLATPRESPMFELARMECQP